MICKFQPDPGNNKTERCKYATRSTCPPNSRLRNKTL